MLDLVPLARARWEVADANSQLLLICEPLQLVLPDPRAVAVAAAGVGGDEDLASVRIADRADLSSLFSAREQSR